MMTITQQVAAGGQGAARGTIMDVQHVVILMQENRSFDHYFGTLRGVRGFGDRFPVPTMPAAAPAAPMAASAAGEALGTHASAYQEAAPPQPGTVWWQRHENAGAAPALVAPFHLDTRAAFARMRVLGTPHTWPNAQRAWDHGRLAAWPTYKQPHSMGYFTAADLPYQFALAGLFTVCDAYHASLQAGTNPNRVMAWTGSIDPHQQGGGPVIGNSYDQLGYDPAGGYLWTSYPERLQAAGISWQIYQDMADNYTDNPLAGFRRFRHAVAGSMPADRDAAALKARAFTTRTLAQLKADVVAGALPQVSYIIATAEGSEHPVPSSPAQGAAYTAAVIDALTSNAAVWNKTVLLLMFDENDGFFDHVPPPAVPSYEAWSDDPAQRRLAGASTVDTTGEYHHHASAEPTEAADLMHRPYGLGPRVPMTVISPWSRGGWVNSQVFDHTSIIRFLEQRFGVIEPNISPWRRAVCGDLTSAFDFTQPDTSPWTHLLPDTAALAARARQLGQATQPAIPDKQQLPVQEAGTRPSRALPYALDVTDRLHQAPVVELSLANNGKAAAVFHVYDRLAPERLPRRYTVEPGRSLGDRWHAHAQGQYDLWVLGPNGFHRHFGGRADAAESLQVRALQHAGSGELELVLNNAGHAALSALIVANAYLELDATTLDLAPGQEVRQRWNMTEHGCWYDFSVRLPALPDYVRRFAGRIETGKHSISDPAVAASGKPLASV